MTVFGPITASTVVRKRALTTLQTWLPTYIGEYERQSGWEGPEIANPKSWGIPTSRFDKWPEAMAPHVAVMTTGTTGTPDIDGDKFYSVWWGFEVTSVVVADTPENTLGLSEIYAAVVAAVLVEQPLGDPVEEVRWVGQDDDPVTSDKDRTMVAVTSRFTAYVDDVLQAGAGPRVVPDPARDPAPDDPEVESVGVVGVRLPVSG